MRTTYALTALAAVFAVSAALAQQPQTQRLRGTIEKVDGNVLSVKLRDGAAATLKLADNAVVVAVLKATLADIKQGDYVGAGAIPQPDGSQKALEVHIFAASMRGQGDGHRPWDGADGGTMTNGEVGNVVTSVDGNVLLVKYKDGEKKIIVPPNIPIVRYEIGDKTDVKVGPAFSVVAATKQADGTFTSGRINVARPGAVIF
jgi:Cu/Ag efflux protein CusF